MDKIAIVIGLIFLFAIVMLIPDGRVLKADRDAEKSICQEMANEVQAGTASRFDYMATRCAAGLLIKTEGQ